MLSFELSDEQKEIRDWVHDFAEREIRPVAHQYDESEAIPWEVVKKASQSGRYSIDFIHQTYPDRAIKHGPHAGNTAGVVDGAAAVLHASDDYVKAHGLTPRARVVASSNMGDDPTLMLNAPVPSARKILK